MAIVMLERTADWVKRSGAKSYTEFVDSNEQRYGKLTFAVGRDAVWTKEIISAIPGAEQLTHDEAQDIANGPDKELCGSFQEALGKDEWLYTVPPNGSDAAVLYRGKPSGILRAYEQGWPEGAAPVVLFKLMPPMEEKRYKDDTAIPIASDLTEKSALLRRAWTLKRTDSAPHMQERSHKAQ